MKIKVSKKGLTLLEILITLGIFALVGTLLFVIITNSAGIYYKESSKIQSGLNTNDALMQVRENIKQSSAVMGSFTSGSTTYNSSNTQIVLKISSIDASSNIIPDTFDYFIYFLDQNKLRLKTFPNISSTRKPQDRIFSTSVNSVLFQYLNSATPPAEVAPPDALKIRVTLTLKQKSGTDFEVQISTSEANLRNN